MVTWSSWCVAAGRKPRRSWLGFRGSSNPSGSDSLIPRRLTHIDDGLDFLGFRIQRRLRANKKPCVYTFVSNEALVSIKRKTKALTKMSTVNLSLHQLIQALNPILRGWATHFRHAAAKRTFSYVGYFV